MKPARPRKSLAFRLFRWFFFWFVLPLVLAYIVIAVWHPEQRFVPDLLAKIRSQTGVLITYQTINVTPGFELKFTGLNVEQDPEHVYVIEGRQYKAPSSIYFQADEAVIGVSWKSLLKGLAGVAYHFKAYSGTIDGTAEAGISARSDPLILKPAWQNLSCESLRRNFPDLPFRQGSISGIADLEYMPEKIFGMSGRVDFSGDGVDYQLSPELSGAANISSIKKMRGTLHFKEERIELDQIMGYGDIASFRLDGTIIQNMIPERSQLDLKIRIYSDTESEPTESTAYLPLSVTGTAGDPIIDFMGMKWDSTGSYQ